MSRILFIICLLLTFLIPLKGQGKLRLAGQERTFLKIPFEISQNLIIIPARINGSERLKFILDSGISNTLITELTGVDTVSLRYAREVRLEGLGGGSPLKAWYSEKNALLVENPGINNQGIAGSEMDVYVISEDRFEFSRQFGTQINGLVGSDFFTDFIIEIDYIGKMLTFHQRDNFNFQKRTKRHTRIPLSIENQRPYLQARITQEDGSQVNTKLMIDTGASMAMWISTFSDPGIILPEVTVPALLGQGLNGDITGVNGRIKEVTIGPFSLSSPIVAFPDSISIAGMHSETGRHGTLGNDILKRFHVIFDYEGNQCFLKPNKNFKDRFYYNRSGLEIEKPFFNVPAYHIYNVVPGSPGDLAGIKEGDQIEMINSSFALNLELEQVNSILYGNHGKTIILMINREGEKLRFKFKLDSRL